MQRNSFTGKGKHAELDWRKSEPGKGPIPCTKGPETAVRRTASLEIYYLKITPCNNSWSKQHFQGRVSCQQSLLNLFSGLIQQCLVSIQNPSNSTGRKNPDTRNEKACGLQIPYWQISNAIYQALEETETAICCTVL